LLCTLFVVLGMSFACSPVPYNTSSDSPYARPVKPEDLFVEEADQVFRIEPGDSLEVVVRRGAGEERSLVTVRDNGRVYVGSLDIDVKNLTLPEAEARITEQAATIIRNPRVEVSIKQKKAPAAQAESLFAGRGNRATDVRRILNGWHGEDTRAGQKDDGGPTHRAGWVQ